MKIKNGDKVIVIAGKEKGKEGVVIETIPNKDQVIIEGVNVRKKHVKPSQTNQEGGIIEEEGPIHASNVLIKEGNVVGKAEGTIEGCVVGHLLGNTVGTHVGNAVGTPEGTTDG